MLLSIQRYFPNDFNPFKVLKNLNYVHITLLEHVGAKCFEVPHLLKDAYYC